MVFFKIANRRECGIAWSKRLEPFVKLMSKNSVSGHGQVKEARHFAVVCYRKSLFLTDRELKRLSEREGGRYTVKNVRVFPPSGLSLTKLN